MAKTILTPRGKKLLARAAKLTAAVRKAHSRYKILMAKYQAQLKDIEKELNNE